MAAPKGNKNATKTKPWLAALERHAAQNPDTLRAIAVKVFEAAIEGEAWAITELGNRLDGKPVQQVVMDASIEDKTVRDLSDAELLRIVAAHQAKRKERQNGETIQ